MKTPMTLYLWAILFFATSQASAQLENKGWWTRNLVSFTRFHDANGNGQNLATTNGRFWTQPEFGYSLNSRWLVGVIGQYSHQYDRVGLSDGADGRFRSDSRYFGFGPLVRHYIPLGPRVAFMPEFFFSWFFSERQQFSLQNGEEVKEVTRGNSIGAGTFPSFVCFLSRDWAISLTVASVQYYGNRDGSSFVFEVNPQQWLLGVEYYFERKKRQ